VGDLGEARRFWVEGLGAADRAVREEGRWLCVGYRGPVPAWCLDLFLVEGRGPGADAYLDDAGFSCVALLSNRLDDDLRRAVAAGGRAVGDPFELTVNRRALRIALLRGPAGELVELIQPLRS
jgi:hypothetical protein